MTVSITIIVALATLLAITNSQFYNNRTKCHNNRLKFSEEFSYFIYTVQNQGAQFSVTQQVFMATQKLYNHGYGVKQTQAGMSISKGHTCQKYFESKGQNICCKYQDIVQATDAMIKLFSDWFEPSRHPIVDYVYKIKEKQASLGDSCLQAKYLTLPSQDGYTYTSASGQLADLIRQIDTQINKIKTLQKQFIKSTICLFCLGVNDLKTFLHPKYLSDRRISNNLIYNQQYFEQVTGKVAQVMWQVSQNLAGRVLSNLKSSNVLGKIGRGSNCQPLKDLINDQNQFTKRKVCKSYDLCKKFAQNYIGMPGAPAYSTFFASVAKSRSMTKVGSRLVTDVKNCGFNGDIPTSINGRYTGSQPPIFEIKGGEYTYA